MVASSFGASVLVEIQVLTSTLTQVDGLPKSYVTCFVWAWAILMHE